MPPARAPRHTSESVFPPAGGTQPDAASGRSWLLPTGILLAVIAVGLGAIAHDKPAYAVLGWLLASLGCFGAVAVHSYRDARRRAANWVLASQPPDVARFAVLLIGLAAILLNAWQFADWYAR